MHPMIYHSNKDKRNIAAHKNLLLCAVLFIPIFFNVDALASRNIDFSILQDSLSLETNRTKSKLGYIMDNKVFQSTYAPLTLAVEGLCFKPYERNFRDMRNRNFSSFVYDYDTYLQFLPLACTYSLKLFGIKSRSSWKEMFSSTVASYTLGYGMAKLIKKNVSELRPDGGGYRSFPSGHTTIAFINATILTKEYKQQYPWIGALAYSTATITGLSRVANNRHWMKDVLFGASLGILMTEVSYGLTDLWFNKKHFSLFDNDDMCDDYDKVKPSFVNIYLSYNRLLTSSDKTKLNNGTSYTIDNGVSIALEGAYFFNNHWGVNARLKEDAYKFENENIWWPRDSVLCVNTAEIGPIYSINLNDRLFGGIRAGFGFNYVQNNQLEESIEIDEQTNFLFSSGCFVNLWVKKDVFLRFFTDYYLSRIKIEDKHKNISSLNFAFTIAFHF